MSRRNSALALKRKADIFAALGDETRLSLVHRLSEGEAKSISHLSSGSKMSRQAVTKHLHVLKEVGLVRSKKVGREILFQLHPAPLQEVSEMLEYFGKQWETTLDRLKKHLEPG